MLLGKDFDPLFMRAVRVLEPYLGDMLCVGGCANALYRYHHRAAQVPWGYIGTKDLDIAVPQKLPDAGRPPVVSLMTEIGLREETYGTAEEAVVKYVPVDEDTPADLEFLCDLSGLPGARTGAPVSHTVQRGLQAQPLRYLSVLFSHPWTVALRRVSGLDEVRDLSIWVPNPAAYVFQKVLIRDQQRSAPSMEKDCFYIYEVSVVFRNAYDAIRDEYRRLEPCNPKWKQRFEVEARMLFADEDSEGSLNVVDVAADSASTVIFGNAPPTAEAVYRSVTRLLEAMTG